jgi:hypothetical protein
MISGKTARRVRMAKGDANEVATLPASSDTDYEPDAEEYEYDNYREDETSSYNEFDNEKTDPDLNMSDDD